VSLTEAGNERIETMLAEQGVLKGSLYDIENVSYVHHVNSALKAHKLFQRDKDYIVKGDQVVIIDEFTGRMMEGRRYSEGLHQALEAKENVTIQNENQTLASITFQNYFRLFPKLAGMTGTAMTEAQELAEIYKLEVIEIPTNLPVVRKDADDEVYRTEREKFDAVVMLVKECQKRKQPVLVGTASIEKSEKLSALFKKAKIAHQVLNARYHEQEAIIISQAGRPGAVTIATNMAGRGTDIQLGGNLDMRLRAELANIEDPDERARRDDAIRADVAALHNEALAAGGLYVVGSERHESRRIDNQLRGRSGRQGDPGASKFYVSLEDDLMRIFGSDRMDGMLQRLGLQEGEAIVHAWINKALEKAQQKVEARNYEIRKQLLKYDDVMNDQRKVVYEQRKEVMGAPDVSTTIADMREEVVETMVARVIPANTLADQWDTDLLHEESLRILGLDLPVADWAAEEGILNDEIRDRLFKAAEDVVAAKEALYGEEFMRMAEKSLLLQFLDQSWKDHLLQLDQLRQGINLRAYAQVDPLNEYKREAFGLFGEMLAALREQVTAMLCHLDVRFEEPEPEPEPELEPLPRSRRLRESRREPALAGGNGAAEAADAAIVAAAAPFARTPRNAPCPCGSGKKYKHCHGRV
ncbi:MAG: preprotein translocase subunit SecA, partial [Stellaceae bacterium]